ncbi:acylase [Phenylobacterium sp.]|uniref:acylase n=1 Tax=Phenylobacterium sp. TaxID=1871053 RepID=UPI002E37F304|nr:acylase [Phenylobacterium sp.]HEX4712874.1 acylase [Phenylobacterium sp.]
MAFRITRRGCGWIAAFAVLAATPALAKPGPAPAAHHDVRIRRDDWGVPHILAKTDVDAAYGLGFAQAEDDMATLQLGVFTARGRLAELQGPSGVESDYLVALQDVWGTVGRRYDRDLDPQVRRILEAYAAGVNAYATRHPKDLAPGLLPITGKDLAASFIYNGPTFYGLDGVFRQTMKPTATKTAALEDEKLPTGSNGLAVAPVRSADGATRLLVNSHQPYTGPLAWYEAVIETGQGWHVAGGFFPGTPFMLHGHNAHLGWANTVNNPDLADVYQLSINPADPDQYRLDGQWKTLAKRTVQIRVKRADGGFDTVEREVLRSAHGPVVRTDHGVFAIRYAGMDEVRQPEQYYRLNKAANLAQWKAAMSLGVLPSINYVYADEKGNIGYVYNGRYPVRKEGVDWSGVVPGDRSDLIWTAQLPFEKIPQLWNPKSGFVFNSNNTPFQATDPADDLKPEAFSKTLGIQTNMTNRAYRVLETVGVQHSIDAKTFNDDKYDLAYSTRSDVAKGVQALLSVPAGDDADLAAAQALVKTWDRRTDVHSRATALVVLTLTKLQGGGSPLAALKASMADLKTHFGRFDPEWGEVNRIRRGKVDLAIDGGPDTYRAVYGRPDPDGRLHALAGDTYVMFVEWDKQGRLSSRSVHQFGSATQDEASPHYADQTPLFVAMKTKPVWFTETQLNGHIAKDYRPPE